MQDGGEGGKAASPCWHLVRPPAAAAGRVCYNRAAKFTRYFEAIRQRPDRASIKLEWIEHVVRNPVRKIAQQDGRIRRWAPIQEMGGRHLRVVLLADGETVHNAFFDRSFAP